MTSAADIGDRATGHRADLLRAAGITKRFGGVMALDRVDFDLRAGEVHALMGENGAGKSTLMKILSGVLTEHDGEILIEAVPVRFAGVRGAERAGVAIIHQELNLVPELSSCREHLPRPRTVQGRSLPRPPRHGHRRGKAPLQPRDRPRPRGAHCRPSHG